MAKTTNSVAKALGLLETMARRPRPWGISELARELGLTKSNVHSHVQTLVELGFIRNDESSAKYLPSLKVWEIGMLVAEGLPVRRAAQPHLTALSATAKKTVHLSVLEGMEAIYIDRIAAPAGFEPKVDIGGRAPAQCVATGLAMMGMLDDESLRRWDCPLSRPTERSPASFDEVMRAVEAARTRGFALTRGSWRRGVMGIAAPIRAPQSEASLNAVAAIGMSCLDIDVSEDEIETLGRYVIYCADRVSEELAKS